MHVSESKHFCLLLINIIALKTPLRCSSVITCYSIVNRCRMTDDQNSQISVDFTNAVDRWITAICMGWKTGPVPKSVRRRINNTNCFGKWTVCPEHYNVSRKFYAIGNTPETYCFFPRYSSLRFCPIQIRIL